MGLDMNVYKVRPNIGKVLSEVDAALDEEELMEFDSDFWYWRKHPNLHGWMKSLYQHKGGTSEDFNCDNVELILEDILELELCVKKDLLPETVGFFFGKSSDEDKEDDLNFIAAAKEALSQGYKLYYTSWW